MDAASAIPISRTGPIEPARPIGCFANIFTNTLWSILPDSLLTSRAWILSGIFLKICRHPVRRTLARQFHGAMQLRLQHPHVWYMGQILRDPYIGRPQIQQLDLFGVLGGAQDQADRCFFTDCPVMLVQPAQVKLHLPLVGGPKLVQLQFDSHQSFQVTVIEQQIEMKVVRADGDALLPGHEGETHAQLQQKALHLSQDGVFQIAFVVILRQPQKIMRRKLREPNAWPYSATNCVDSVDTICYGEAAFLTPTQS